ncbi:MAG TPA: SRPBCC family protein [Candidatus Binataceae bacterium]|nr:SRPBCC family protein [Candidatus Binataceae bacterium]
MDGSIKKVAEGYQLRFERHLKHPIEKVWNALTKSELSAQWLAPAEIDLREGGRVLIRFTNGDTVIDGTVLALKPPNLLEYAWKDQREYRGPVRWELTSESSGTKLILTHTLPFTQTLKPHSFLAGWDSHLEQMVSALDGRPIPWSRDRWQELYDEYAAATSDV